MKKHLFNLFVEINPKTTSTLRDEISNAVFQQGADEIILAISSTGGSLESGFSLYNFLRTLRKPITTINMGSTESIALIPYLAGDTRVTLASSKFLIHGFQWTFSNGSVSHSVLKEYVASLDADVTRYAQIFNDCTKKGKQHLDVLKHLNGDPLFLLANESLNYGISHSIVEPDFPTKDSPVVWWVNNQ